MTKYPYPIEDYRDASRYPKSRDVGAWRWQFLRRNAEYQEFFETERAERDRQGGHRTYAMALEGFQRFGVYVLGDPRDRLGSPISGGAVTTPDEVQVLTERKRRLVEIERELGIPVEHTIERLVRWDEFRYPPGFAFVWIDTTIPLGPQFAIAAKLIDSPAESKRHKSAVNKNRPIRYHTAKFPNYCRILDGHAAGASFSEIAATLFPHIRKAKDYEAAASVTARVRKDYVVALNLTRTFGARGK